ELHVRRAEGLERTPERPRDVLCRLWPPEQTADCGAAEMASGGPHGCRRAPADVTAARLREGQRKERWQAVGHVTSGAPGRAPWKASKRLPREGAILIGDDPFRSPCCPGIVWSDVVPRDRLRLRRDARHRRPHRAGDPRAARPRSPC